MTDWEFVEVGQAFSASLRRFRPCFLLERTKSHIDTFCFGLFSDLPPESV